MSFVASSLKAFCVLAVLGPVALCAADPAVRNLVLNPGFEEDNDNIRGERMSCPVAQRVTYGQRDGLPDLWTFDAKQVSRRSSAHTGQFALQISPKNKAPVVASVQSFVARQSELPRISFSAWVKGQKSQDALTVTLNLSILGKDPDPKKNQDAKALAYTFINKLPGSTEWKAVSFDVPTRDLAVALGKMRFESGVITGGVSLSGTGNQGELLVDDVALTTPDVPAAYTLVPNAGFEKLNVDGSPTGWSPARKSLRYFGRTYYVWRDWFHFFGLPRGANVVDSLVVRSGKNSFRMNVPPGDDKYIESSAIPLKQTGPQKMLVQFNYNTVLLANMFVQVVDEEGHEIFGQNITPGNSHGWRTFHAEFLPRRAAQKPGSASAGADLYGPDGDPISVKSCRVRIGAKGVNGSPMDDINEWINVNHAGALWVDNVVLQESQSTKEQLVARGLQPLPLDALSKSVTIQTIDLGERLYGENVATIRIRNGGDHPLSGTATLTLRGPFVERDPKKTGGANSTIESSAPASADQPKPVSESRRVPYRVSSGGETTIEIPYHFTQLLKDWRSEYRLQLSLFSGNQVEIPLGTWSQQALVDVERAYAFPEFKTQRVFVNLGIARRTLAQSNKLLLNVHRARDHQIVYQKEIPNFRELLAGFNQTPLPEGFEGDSTNFFIAEFPLDALPVHPQTKPTRDHYVTISGIGSAARDSAADFVGTSPRFGRMEAHNEKLDSIRSVTIDPGNYLRINNKPFFSRGHLWMQQNFGPGPLARQNTEWKKYGFNNRAGIQFPLQESNPQDRQFGAGVDDLWNLHNMYLGSQMISQKGPMSPAIQADIRKWLAKPNIIGIHFVPWEGSPAGTPAEAVQYAHDIKGQIGSRPLWISAGWFAPAVNGMIEPWKSVMPHDWFVPENNSYFQPSQLDKEILPLKRGTPCVLGTYVNVFNDAPYNVQRFEHWTEIIRGHTGYMEIGKPGDQTLMAGMNGELRHIESFLFSQERAPSVQASPEVPHLVRSNKQGSYLLATNAGPVIGGDWEWSDKLKVHGRGSHTGTTLWDRLHNYMKDYRAHWFKDAPAITMSKGDRIVQYVYIPSDEKVKHLTLMVRGNGAWRQHAVWGDFNHEHFTDSGVRLWLAKDMHQMSWGTIAIGFCGAEGHSPNNPDLLKYTFTADQYHKLGALPRTGQWVRLEVPVEELGLVGAVVDGVGFVNQGGKVWWERTLLVHNGREEVLLDGSVGAPPSALKNVRFNVEGLKAGTKIQVAFEEREIIAKDGYFQDDLSGEEGYRNQWVGIYGDKLGETGYYGDGVFYNYNGGKVAARLYEIPR